LTHTLPDDDLDETNGTAPRNHLSHQRSSTTIGFSTTTLCRLFQVTSPNDGHPSPPHNGMPAISTRSIHRPTDARPEALVVASPGQAQLQIFDLALIPIVIIRPQINHMKLNEYTRRLHLSPSVHISRSELFPFYCSLSRCYNLKPSMCFYTRIGSLTTDLSNLLKLGLGTRTKTAKD
jgi:hypothetical protein